MSIYEEFMRLAPLRHKKALLKHALSLRNPNGLILEFGVFRGRSLNIIASQCADQQVFGFDSFNGLPEDWVMSNIRTRKRGCFRTPIPTVKPNVTLVVGEFATTVPKFFANNSEPVSFANIDCDLYSSTKDILWNMNKNLVTGSILYFDELCDWGNGKRKYDNWPDHEYKALMEWKHEFNRAVLAIARDSAHSAILRIE